MTLTTLRTLFLALILSATSAWAAEPLLGRWLLVSQQINGQKTPVEEMLLRVVASGPALEFAYSVPLNNIQFVAVRYIARPDGAEAEVTGSNGKPMGTVKVTRAGAAQYKIVLQGPNKPTATGTMTVSADGKTLTSTSESTPPGQTTATRMVQVFARQQ